MGTSTQHGHSRCSLPNNACSHQQSTCSTGAARRQSERQRPDSRSPLSLHAAAAGRTLPLPAPALAAAAGQSCRKKMKMFHAQLRAAAVAGLSGGQVWDAVAIAAARRPLLPLPQKWGTATRGMEGYNRCSSSTQKHCRAAAARGRRRKGSAWHGGTC